MIRRSFLKLLTLLGTNTTLSAENTVDSIKEKKLKPIELNEFDSNAIQVYHKQLKIGYIPKVENKIIAKIMDQHIRIVAKVTKFNADEKFTHKIKVKLYQLPT